MLLKNKSILVIDEKEETSRELCRVLANAGAVLFKATDLATGFPVAIAKRPDVIVLHVCAATENSRAYTDLLWNIRQKVGFKDCFVLLLLAKTKEAMLPELLAAGANDWLYEPLQAASLLRKLRHFFQRRREFIYNFPDATHLMARVTAELAQLNEAGCVITAPMLLAKRERIDVRGSFFDELNLGDAILVAVPAAEPSFRSGWYVNRLSFVGIVEQTAAKIRRLVRDWGR